MEDTQLGARGRTFVCKSRRPQCTCRVNTPQMKDSPAEWARWMWGYPRELTTRPGIHHARDGISLLSVQGMQMALGRAPRGASVQCARHVFILPIAELLATRGMYRQLVDQLRLTIASTSRMSVAQTMDNVTVEDVARVLAADGVTIPQARDAHEWG